VLLTSCLGLDDNRALVVYQYQVWNTVISLKLGPWHGRVSDFKPVGEGSPTEPLTLTREGGLRVRVWVQCPRYQLGIGIFLRRQIGDAEQVVSCEPLPQANDLRAKSC
jgi:hypothetical protein